MGVSASNELEEVVSSYAGEIVVYPAAQSMIDTMLGSGILLRTSDGAWADAYAVQAFASVNAGLEGLMIMRALNRTKLGKQRRT